MDTKNISDQAYSKIMDKLTKIEKSLEQKTKKEKLIDDWMDVSEVCRTLKVSKRTLQYYRTNGSLPSSKVGAKIYFKASDVQKVLEMNYS
jgi:excisionase family DNA binding protein